MLADLPGTLELAAGFLPTTLYGARARAQVGRIPAVLPACIAVGTFEARLDSSEQVDYQVCFTAKSGGRDALATWLVGVDDVDVEPSWRPSIEFLRYWSTPGSLLYKNSPAAWLEFDCPLDEPEPPVPFPFFSLHPPWEDIHIPFPEMLATVEEGFDKLSGGCCGAGLKERIRRTLCRIKRGRLIHTALRPVGDGHVARLIVKMPVTEMAPCLERLEWPFPTAGFADFIAHYCTSKLVQTIQLDVTPAGIGPRVGVEFFYDSAPRHDRRWQELLDKLIADGACTPERREQVEAWVGSPSDDKLELILRGLLIKVIYHPKAALEAKAYLPFCVNPLLDAVMENSASREACVSDSSPS